VTDTPVIDLNVDVGEGFDDGPLYALATSANIACGGHAGNTASMARALESALAMGVAVGAHPGYPDPARFGRVSMAFPAPGLTAEIARQIETLVRCAEAAGAAVRHVKPHGALYHDVAADPATARAVADGVKRVLPEACLLGFAGSPVLEIWRSMGFAVAAEGFADRGYAPGGGLLPRGTPRSLLGAAEAGDQAVRLARGGAIDTLCVHSDTPGAAAVAEHVRRKLVAAGFALAPLARRGAGS